LRRKNSKTSRIGIKKPKIDTSPKPKSQSQSPQSQSQCLIDDNFIPVDNVDVTGVIDIIILIPEAPSSSDSE